MPIVKNNRTAFAIFLAFLLLITIGLAFYPGHNGDMAHYVAAIVRMEKGAGVDATVEAKKILRTELNPIEAEGQSSFLDQTDISTADFYAVKPIYILMATACRQLGCSYTFATVLPSLIGYFLFCMLIFLWSAKLFAPWKAVAVSMVLSMISPVEVLARISSPDAISNFVMATVLFNIFFERRQVITIALLLLAVVVRLDNGLAVGVILTAMLFWPDRGSPNRLKPSWYFVLIFFLLIEGTAINYFSTEEFWWFRRMIYLHSGRNYLTQVLYYYNGISASLTVVFLLFILLMWPALRLSFRERNGYSLLMVVAVIAGRFVIFPEYESRFFTAFDIFSLFVIARALKLTRNGAKSNLAFYSE